VVREITNFFAFACASSAKSMKKGFTAVPMNPFFNSINQNQRLKDQSTRPLFQTLVVVIAIWAVDVTFFLIGILCQFFRGHLLVGDLGQFDDVIDDLLFKQRCAQ